MLLSDEHFLPLVSEDPDTWDDSALIDAYERAISSAQATRSQQLHTQTTNQKTKLPEKRMNNTADTMAIEKDKGLPRKRKRGSSVEQLQQKSSKEPDRRISPTKIPDIQPPSSYVFTAGNTNANARNLAQQSHDIQIPAPPAPTVTGALNDDLRQLLMAWYEAGYRAGVYVGRHGKE